MAKLEQSRSWIPDAQGVKLTFSKTVTFYFIKIENSIKQISNSSYTIVDISEIF